MNLLVVDDDRVARFLLHRMLQSEFHCQIIEAADGQAAWELLQGGLVPDLCVLDIMMPRMDGLELLQKIRGVHRLKSMRVIMCTTVQERGKFIQATSLDIACYLGKPFTQKRVVEQVRKALKLEVGAGLEDDNADSRQPVKRGMNEYLCQLTELVKETTHQIELVREALTCGDRGSAAEHLQNLLHRSQKLGITGLGDAIGKALDHVFLDSQQTVFSHLGRIEFENQGVVATIEKLAKAHIDQAATSAADEVSAELAGCSSTGTSSLTA
jgi:two-component system chemotaxis response regulator CheY